MNSARTDSMFASPLRDPEHQDAFLVHLAEDVRQGNVALDGLTVPGVVGVCLQTGRPTFTPSHDGETPSVLAARDQTLRLSYEHQGNNSWFDTRVTGEGAAGAWQLQRPAAVTTSARRLVPRYRFAPGTGLELMLAEAGPSGQGSPLPLCDLSTDGLGVLFYPQRTPIKRRQRIHGSLQMPGQRELCVELSVVTVTVPRPGSRLRRASARFVSMPLEDRLQLAAAITALSLGRRADVSVAAK